MRAAPGDYGYGAIYQRASDARWMASVDLPRQRGAARRRRTFSAATREGVLAKLDAFRAAHPVDKRLTRVEYMEQARALGTHTAAEYWAKGP